MKCVSVSYFALFSGKFLKAIECRSIFPTKNKIELVVKCESGNSATPTTVPSDRHPSDLNWWCTIGCRWSTVLGIKTSNLRFPGN